jgi:hypothetical protein
MNILEVVKYPIGTEFEVWSEDNDEYSEGTVVIVDTPKGKCGKKTIHWKGTGEYVSLSDYTTELDYRLAEKPVSFAEAVSNATNQIRVDLSYLDFSSHNKIDLNKYMDIKEMLWQLQERFSNVGVVEAINEGKWFIKDNGGNK